MRRLAPGCTLIKTIPQSSCPSIVPALVLAMKNRAEGRLPVDRIGHFRMQGCQHISLQHNFLLCFLMGSAMVFSANDKTPLRYPRLLTIAGSDSGGGAG